MLILTLDSCGASCGVCVWQDGKVLAQEQDYMERGQDARLMPMVMSVMQKSQCAFAHLDKIAVTRGPGSFTGTRVGLATARGIGLASAKPVIGIDRFALYRAKHPAKDTNLLVVIDSKRSESFCKFFPAIGLPTEAFMMTEEEIQVFLKSQTDTNIVGDKAALDDDILAICAELAQYVDAKNTAYLPLPLYLRAPDVSFAKSR